MFAEVISYHSKAETAKQTSSKNGLNAEIKGSGVPGLVALLAPRVQESIHTLLNWSGKAPGNINVFYNNPIRTNHHWKGDQGVMQ